jgi:hypothetical protein
MVTTQEKQNTPTKLKGAQPLWESNIRECEADEIQIISLLKNMDKPNVKL